MRQHPIKNTGEFWLFGCAGQHLADHGPTTLPGPVTTAMLKLLDVPGDIRRMLNTDVLPPLIGSPLIARVPVDSVEVLPDGERAGSNLVE